MIKLVNKVKVCLIFFVITGFQFFAFSQDETIVIEAESGSLGSDYKTETDGFLSSAYQKVESYLNPVLPGDHPDLTLLKDGDDFYVCGSHFQFTPYLAISHSTDLVHWEVISRVIPSDWTGLINDAPGTGIWEGAITYFYGSYWIYFSNTAGGGQYFSKADSPKGPWSLPVKVQVTYDTGAIGYDNSVFVDDDGTPYMLIKNGEYVNRIQEIGSNGHLTGNVMNMDWVNADKKYSWAEGPVMCKRDGWYYYFVAGNIYGGQWVLKSQTLTADQSAWTELGTFFETITDSKTPFRGPNHITQPVQIADGTWWTLSHSYENVSGDNWEGKGRQGLLHQVIWDSTGKPVGKAPTTSPSKKPDLPKNGIPWKLSRTDYFDDPVLSVDWHFMNKVAATKYELNKRTGWLSLDPGTETAHLLQKDVGHFYSIVTKVDVDATAEGQMGGLYVCNGNESKSVKLVNGFKNGQQKIMFSFENVAFETNNEIGNTVWLKLDRYEHVLTAYFSADGKVWTQVGDGIDVSDMDKTQDQYNWWVGNSQGLYAAGVEAFFDLFYYRDGMSELPVIGNENHFGITKISNGESYVTNSSENGGWLMMGGIEFGNASRKINNVVLTASATSAGNVEIWIDDLENEGTKIATVNITETGSENAWQEFSATVEDVSGQHDVFLRFSAPTQSIFVKSLSFDGNVIDSDHTAIHSDLPWIEPVENPFSNYLIIESNVEDMQYSISDLRGRIVEVGYINEPVQNIADKLSPDFYILALEHNSDICTYKLLKKE